MNHRTFFASTIAIVNTRMATPSQTHLQIFSSMGILTGSPSDPGAHRPFNPLNVKSCCKSDFFSGRSAWQQSPSLPHSEGASGLGRPSGMRLTRCLKVLPDGERTGILDKRNKRKASTRLSGRRPKADARVGPSPRGGLILPCPLSIQLKRKGLKAPQAIRQTRAVLGGRTSYNTTHRSSGLCGVKEKLISSDGVGVHSTGFSPPTGF